MRSAVASKRWRTLAVSLISEWPLDLGPRYTEILSPVRANYRICIIVSNRNECAKKLDDLKASRFEILKARILLLRGARSNSRDELHICAHMMRNKNKVSRNVAAACTGINPWTFEDVCRMPLHKFRVNCTSPVATLFVLVSRSQSFPAFLSISPFPIFSLVQSLISLSLARFLPCSLPSMLPRNWYFSLSLSLSIYLLIYMSIQRSLRAATSNYSNASRVQRG